MTVKISILLVISASERSLMLAYTRKPCCGRETAWCHCKIWYLSKLASLGSPCDSMVLVNSLLLDMNQCFILLIQH